MQTFIVYNKLLEFKNLNFTETNIKNILYIC